MSFSHVPSTSAVANALKPFRTNADDLVNERFQYALDYANQAFIDSFDLMDRIMQLAEDLHHITVPDPYQPVDPPNTGALNGQDIPQPSDFGITSEIVQPLDKDALSYIWNPESIYTSDLIEELRSKLSTDMSGGTGISSSVETDMINRETERDAIINEGIISTLEADWADDGWSMPDGVIAFNKTQVYTEYQNKRTDKSRDIRVESFNLAQKNIHFAMGLTSDIEGKLMVYQAGMMERALKAAREKVEMAIKAFEAQVAYFNAKVALYTSNLEAHKALWELLSIGLKIDIAVFEASVKQALGEGQLILEKARIQITEYLERNKLRLSSMEEAAKVAATVAAGALTGISAQAHISSSDSLNASGSVSYQGQETKYTDETPNE